MKSKSNVVIAAIGTGLFLAALGFYIMFVKMPADLAKNLALGVKETFNFTPKVRVNETIVFEQNTPILEVATVGRDLSVDYSWTHQWLGSSKTITLHATFTAKAGFDLKEPFAIDIQKLPLKVRAELPEPKILSIQMNSYNIVRDENGWWNRISDEDRETAVRALQQTAFEKARNSGILSEVRTTAEQRITDIVKRNGAVVEFSYPWQEK